MAKLVYSAITSLDGYIEDDQGAFGWAAPDEEVHAFVNDLLCPIGTYLYGRRMYETMVFWETVDSGNRSAVARDFATLWRKADKVVYSRSLQTVSSAKTRIERDLDLTALRRLKETSASDITVGGAELTAQMIAAGLVDEIHLLLGPVVVGAGKKALPTSAHLPLRLIGERRFQSGVVHLHYRLEH